MLMTVKIVLSGFFHGLSMNAIEPENYNIFNNYSLSPNRLLTQRPRGQEEKSF